MYSGRGPARPVPFLVSERGLLIWFLFVLLIPLSALGPLAADPKSDTKPLGEVAAVDPPKPGSYKLMHIMPAADGLVLDADGQRRHLAQFTKGKVTLLSFIYSSCGDPQGCPFAFVVFHQLKDRLAKAPQLHGKVRLVSLSFDPKRDTPEVMRAYGSGESGKADAVEWAFLTTSSTRELVPILDSYGQDVFRELDPVTKQPRSTFRHMLKVFLIDPAGVVREIYSSAYLKPDMVYSDIVTLLMEKPTITQ